MPSCLKCGFFNGPGAKYCAGCAAVLLQMAPSGVPGSALEVDEGTEYYQPPGHYPAPELLNLSWAAHDFLLGGADLDPFLDCYQVVADRFASYRDGAMQEFLELMANERNLNPSDPYPRQMLYLNNKAVSLFEEGILNVERFLDALDRNQVLPDLLKRGVVSLVGANDHFCYAVQLTEERTLALETTLEDTPRRPSQGGTLQGASAEEH